MAYKISTTHQFEKDLKRCIKRGYPMDEFRIGSRGRRSASPLCALRIQSNCLYLQ